MMWYSETLRKRRKAKIEQLTRDIHILTFFVEHDDSPYGEWAANRRRQLAFKRSDLIKKLGENV